MQISKSDYKEFKQNPGYKTNERKQLNLISYFTNHSV